MPTPSCRPSRPSRSDRSSSTATRPEQTDRADPPGRVAARFPALASPVYRRFLVGAMVATVGGFMQSTSQGWLVLVLTGSPALLGMTSAAANLPTLFLAVVAGVLADRVDRRRLLVATNIAGALCALVLALLTTTNAVRFEHVLVLAFLSGLALTVQTPANQAVVSTIVDRDSIGNAVALNSAQYNLSRIFAPAAAGLLIAAGGLALGFWVNSLALLLVAVVIAGLPIPSPRTLDRVQAALWTDLGDGLRYVARDRLLVLLALLPAAPALLVLNYLAFIPVYARDILDIGAGGLGLLTGAIGIGALSGALTVAALRPSGGSGRMMLLGLATTAVALVTFALSRSLLVSMAALAVLGAAQVAYYSTTNTLLQVLVPARLRGRVISIYVLTSTGLLPVGNLVGGAIAERTGVPAVLAAGGALTALLVAVVWLAEPRLARLRASTLVRDEARDERPEAPPSKA